MLDLIDHKLIIDSSNVDPSHNFHLKPRTMTEERPGAGIHGMTMETWYLMCNAECKAWKNDYKFGHQTPGDTCYANMITLTFNINIQQ